jgi:hypothetical protein
MRRILVGFALGVVLSLGAMRLLSASAGAPVPKPGDVITGYDFGFRVKTVGDGHLVGTFVVRVNGNWRPVEEASLPPRVIPAKP